MTNNLADTTIRSIWSKIHFNWNKCKVICERRMTQFTVIKWELFPWKTVMGRVWGCMIWKSWSDSHGCSLFMQNSVKLKNAGDPLWAPNSNKIWSLTSPSTGSRFLTLFNHQNLSLFLPSFKCFITKMTFHHGKHFWTEIVEGRLAVQQYFSFLC